METIPDTLEKWYEAAIRFDNQYHRLKRALQANNRSPPFRRNNYHQNSNQTTKINRLTDEQAAAYRREGKCFRCGKQGHISRNCDQRPQGSSTPTPFNRNTYNRAATRNIRSANADTAPDSPAEGSTEDKAARIRALWESMNEEDRESVIDKLEMPGF